LALVTHAELGVWGDLSIQWLTERDTAACVTLQDVNDSAPLWSALKTTRDSLWATIEPAQQVDAAWLSASMPGMHWRNTGTLEEMRQVHSVFLSGGEPATSARHCSLMVHARADG
jgi:hypothetical protein